MQTASQLTLIACGLFFLTGLVTGVWKYLATRRDPVVGAHRYISVAHNASLNYAFAALVMTKLLELSPFSAATNLVAAAAPLFFFASAIAIYIIHGALRDTDNQFLPPYRIGKLRLTPFTFHAFVWLLILGEIGGFLVLFVGALQTLLSR